MDNNPEPLRERLLAQFEPDRDKLAAYRKEVQAMLEKNERALRLQKWYAGSIDRFSKLLKTDPEYSNRGDVYFYLAESYVKAKLQAQALPYYDKLVT